MMWVQAYRTCDSPLPGMVEAGLQVSTPTFFDGFTEAEVLETSGNIAPHDQQLSSRELVLKAGHGTIPWDWDDRFVGCCHYAQDGHCRHHPHFVWG